MKLNRVFPATRSAFTLTDLCVAMGVILLVMVMMPAIVRRASESSSKSRCSSNLKNIAAALITYSNTNGNNYPRTHFDPDHPATTQFTGINASDPFKSDGPQPNDVTAAVYLLLRTSGMTPIVFVCPTSPGEPFSPEDRGLILSKSNFPSPQNLSYSFNNPYPSAKALASGWKWDSSLGTDYAIAADLNPGSAAPASVPSSASTATMKTVNSPNHGFMGQNVLYGDYHVAWQPSPWCGDPRRVPGGTENDNIYTSETSPPSVGGMPQDVNDSVLLPMATDGFVGHGPSVQDIARRSWTGVVIAFAVIGIMVVLAIQITRQRRKPAKGH